MTTREWGMTLGLAAMLAAPASAGNGRFNKVGALNTDKLLAVPRVAGEQRAIIGGFKSLSGMDSAAATARRPGRVKFNDIVLKRGVFETAPKVDGFSLKQKPIEVRDGDRFNGAYLVQGVTHRHGSNSVGSSETITIGVDRTRSGAVSYTHLTLPTICSV